MIRKTFNQILTERTPAEIYPVIIPAALRETIEEWFKYRYISGEDDEHFLTYFRRVLMRDYGRYSQILRIQPDITDYDWLVQQYQEAQTYIHNIGEGGKSEESSLDISKEIDHGKTIDFIPDAENPETVETVHGQKITQGGKDELKHGHTIATTGTDEIELSGTDETSYGRKITTEDEGQQQASGADAVNSTSVTDSKTLHKEPPQSTVYSSGIDIANSQGNIATVTPGTVDDTGGTPTTYTTPTEVAGGVLDWTHPGDQSETADRDQDSSLTAYGRRDENYSKSETENSGKDEVTYGKKSTRTPDLEEAHTGTDEQTYGKTETWSGTDTTTTSRQGYSTQEGGKTEETTGHEVTRDIGETHEDETLTQHITTGRGIDTATLLSQAAAYIMGTSAWEWLFPRLDTCFIGVYDI